MSVLHSRRWRHSMEPFFNVSQRAATGQFVHHIRVEQIHDESLVELNRVTGQPGVALVFDPFRMKPAPSGVHQSRQTAVCGPNPNPEARGPNLQGE